MKDKAGWDDAAGARHIWRRVRRFGKHEVKVRIIKKPFTKKIVRAIIKTE